MSNHTHFPRHSSRLDNGAVHEVCDCGATRRIEPAQPEPRWHTCKLCTHKYGLDSK